MNVVLLYDPRQDRDATIAHLIERNIFCGWWPCEHHAESTIKGINASHKYLIRNARDRNLENITILEQDIWFPHPDGWKKYCENLPGPDDYDIYLGGVYGLNESAKKRLENGLCEVNNFQGFHCYTVNSRFYEKFLSVPDDQHIDVVMAGLGVFKVLYPFVALQRPGYSANARGFVDYNKTLNPEDIYQ